MITLQLPKHGERHHRFEIRWHSWMNAELYLPTVLPRQVM